MINIRCEYAGCDREATHPFKLKDGTVIAWYCEEHYKKVINDLAGLDKLINRTWIIAVSPSKKFYVIGILRDRKNVILDLSPAVRISNGEQLKIIKYQRLALDSTKYTVFTVR